MSVFTDEGLYLWAVDLSDRIVKEDRQTQAIIWPESVDHPPQYIELREKEPLALKSIWMSIILEMSSAISVKCKIEYKGSPLHQEAIRVAKTFQLPIIEAYITAVLKHNGV